VADDKGIFHEKLSIINHRDALLLSSAKEIPNENFGVYVLNNFGLSRSNVNEENISEEERKFLENFTSEDFQSINKSLNSTQFHEHIYHVNRAILNSIQTGLPETTFRISHLEPEDVLSYRVGSVIYFSTFVSTSRKILNWNGNTLFMIYLPNNKYVMDLEKYSSFPKEYEILIALNTAFRVVYVYSPPYPLKIHHKIEKEIKYIIALRIVA